MDQVTAVLELPVTVAVNCLLWEEVRLAVSGLTLTPTLAMVTNSTVALADLVISVTLVAVMVTDWGELIVEGAVYVPFDRLPTDGVIDQVTDVFALPITIAVNCLLCDAVKVAVEGLTPTLTLGVGPGRVIVPVPPLAGIEVPVAVEATTPVS